MKITQEREPIFWLKWFATSFILILQFAHAVEFSSNESALDTYSNESICVTSAWSYESLGTLVGAAYMVISARDDITDTLINASSTAAGNVKVHDIVLVDGNMTMTPAKNLTFNQDSPLQMKPHGLHIMLMGLNQPLESGMSIPLTLEFMYSGVMEIEVSVRKFGDNPPAQAMICE